MDKENLRKAVESNLRSVTQSVKGGVPFDSLQRDYRDLLGTLIPYKQLGYDSLEALIRSMPDVVRLTSGKFGPVQVMAVADDTTAHIASLVARQKSLKAPPKIKRSTGRFAFGKRTYPSAKWPSLAPTWRRPETRSTNRPLEPRENRPRIQSYAIRNVRDTISKSNYEVAPRFLRQMQKSEQTKSAPVPRRSPTPPAKSPPSPTKSPSPEPQQEAPEIAPQRTVTLRNNLLPLQITTILPPIQQPVTNFIPPPVTAIETRESFSKEVEPPMPSPPLFPSNSTAKVKAEIYAKSFNLPISFSVTQIGQREKNYICTMKLGDKKYNSFPNEKGSPAEAEEEAASQAIADIERAVQCRKPKLPKASVDTLEELNTLMSRIEEILLKTTKGIMWSKALEKEYEKNFSESLNHDWQTLVQDNLGAFIEITHCENISKQGSVLRYRRTRSGSATPTSTTSGMSNPLLEEALKQFSIRDGNKDIPVMELPDEAQWPILVTCVVNITNICVRLIDNDAFVTMSEEMSDYYATNSLNIERLEEGELYAAKLVDIGETFWHRVRVEKLVADAQKAFCYFVDIGDSSTLEIADLRELAPKYKLIPFQAIRLKLAGLEDYSEIVKLHYLENYLLDKSLIAEVLNREENCVTAILYDTSDDADVNLNELLLEVSFSDFLSSELPEVGATAIGYLAHVGSGGEIYLRFRSPDVCLLQNELEKLTPRFEEPSSRIKYLPVVDQIYVSKYVDGIWYRSVIVPTSDTSISEVEMYFLDYGNTGLVPITDICELGPISKVLASVPPQAVLCMLTDVPNQWTEEAFLKLIELAPETEELIVKLDTPGTEHKPPLVTLYKRNQDSVIVSVNQTLAFSQELFRSNSPTSSVLADKPKSLSFASMTKSPSSLSSNIPDVIASTAFDHTMQKKTITSPTIPWEPTPEVETPGTDGFALGEKEAFTPVYPTIPRVGSLFNVYVTFVASPSNFMVQPLESANKLNNLMNEMQAFYNSEENLCDMHTCLLNEHQLYAALHSDGTWYRAFVMHILGEDPVRATVLFVDFGDYSVVELPNLQLLYQQFKTLPWQALKASLAGVKPRETDWQPEDCVAFKRIVEEHSFVSCIKGVTPSVVSGLETFVLQLELIDTSDKEKDVHIHKLLIDDKIAVAE